MQIKSKIFHNLYQDSVSLMQISAAISKLPGIEQASVVMGTPTNLQQLVDAKLDNNIQAGPNDLIIAVRGEDAACNEALQLAQDKLNSRPAIDAGTELSAPPPSSIQMGLAQDSQANFALISVPGDYAAAEALKALNLGLNVMLFSDNVSPTEEHAVKIVAEQKDLIAMGPDCGTAIINGIPLGFANIVNQGAIGVVAASGTGLQEVTCRIDQLGQGISQALGTGGHDLSETIGGISMQQGLKWLERDAQTKVIVLISKPPAAAIADKILQQAKSMSKPVIIHFLGADESLKANTHNIFYAHTLADAAEQAVSVVTTGHSKPFHNEIKQADLTILQQTITSLAPNRHNIRGVFAGGTFCFEAQLICRQQGIESYSNTPVQGNHKLTNIWSSQDNTIIDMGDDDFTRGKPHPMIDPTLRNERIANEIKDPKTAVVLLDVVLGYGAAINPSEGLLETIAQAKQKCTDNGPVFIAHVCGTQKDIQDREKQISALRQVGILIADSNAQAALWASYIVNQCRNK